MIYPTIFDNKFVESCFFTKEDCYLIKTFDFNNICYSNQIHSDIVLKSEKKGFQGDGDAIWTIKKGLKCIVKVADCVPILFHIDLGKINVVGVIHSGWRGTKKNIVKKTFEDIFENLDIKLSLSNFSNKIKIWIGPSICQNCYKFGSEAKKLFDFKYLKKTSKKDFFL